MGVWDGRFFAETERVSYSESPQASKIKQCRTVCEMICENAKLFSFWILGVLLYQHITLAVQVAIGRRRPVTHHYLPLTQRTIGKESNDGITVGDTERSE